MVRSVMFVVSTIIATSALSSHVSAEWKNGSGNRVMWDNNCDFCGQDIQPVTAPPERCGDLCLANAACTHWAWSYNAQGGTCYLKDRNAARIKYAPGLSCGYVTDRFNPASNNLPPVSPGC